MATTQKSQDEWKQKLDPEVYHVTREKGTEPPFSGTLLHNKETGVYTCSNCGAELFSSETKFDSGSGWPSFYDVSNSEAVELHEDTSYGMNRTEVTCRTCGAHLGHLFPDGPTDKTGQRYCINSLSLNFKKHDTTQTATFAMGCFWCTEAIFQRINGVKKVTSGYMGGTLENPTYEDICEGTTGHAEVAQIEFDPATVTYENLLYVFWRVHNPTSLNKQGADIGTQYRSAIFYHDETQKKIAEHSKKEMQKTFEDLIVTEIAPATTFYPAETYHQDFYKNNQEYPYCKVVIDPKIKKLQQILPNTITS